MPAIAAYDGPVYMRLLRGNVPLVLDEYDYQFELGKAKLIRDGRDVLVISLGLHDDARARGGRAARSRTTSTSRCCTSRRSSRSTRRRSGARPRKSGRLVVVAENHTVVGGLGEAVAGVLLRAGIAPRPSARSALPDEFLLAGALPTLHDRYGISAAAMAQSIKGWL